MKSRTDNRNREGHSRPAHLETSRGLPTFARLVSAGIDGHRVAGGSDVEPLAALDYDSELRIKNEALAEFWRLHRLPGSPEPLRPSPLPRHYRTTTKRRASFRGGTIRLGFADGDGSSDPFPESFLEPASHTAVYRLLLEKLRQPPYHVLAAHLNYVIIRGSYRESVVLFNVDLLNGEIVRKLKLLADHLRKFDHPVISAFVYLDPSRSDYYLEARRPIGRVGFKKLFGPDKYFLDVGERRHLLHPTSFSQINESMIPVMLGAVRELLRPDGDGRLLDLYCGYGLFAHELSGGYKEIVGVDIAGESITTAVASLDHYRPRAAIRFIASGITRGTLSRILPMVNRAWKEFLILDPPRQGTDAGVVEYLASRRPERALHVFCGVDEMPREIRAWNNSGYRVQRILPLDMFAGTPNLEVIILLEPTQRS